MKAYRVYYSTGSKSTSMIVLTEDEGGVEEALSNKDRDYCIGRGHCKIEYSREVGLSNVMVSDLSVMELLTLAKEMKS